MASSSTSIPEDREVILRNSCDLKDRIHDFVKYFVTELEATLKLHYDVLEGNVKKTGPMSTLLAEALGLCTANLLGSSKVANLFKKPLETAFENIEQNKALEYHEIVYWFQKMKTEARSLFVSIAIDVFEIYEFQFIGVTSDRGTPKAMKRLAKDAAQRFMNSYKSKEEEFNRENKKSLLFENTKTFITRPFPTQTLKSKENIEMNARRVVEGKSKSMSIVGIPISKKIKKPGYEIQYKCSACDKLNDDWNTSNLFDEVGVAVKQKDENDFKLYVKKKYNYEMYGYRRNYSEENFQNYEPSKICENICRRPRFLKLANFYKTQHASILKKINDGDTVAVQQRILKLAETLQKQMKGGFQQLKDEFKNQHDKTRKQQMQAKEILFEQLGNILNVDKEILKDLESAKAEREKIAADLKDTVKKESQLIQNKIDNLNIEKKDKNERISFRLNKPVKSFEGRKEELKSIHNALENGRKTTIISQAVSIAGLGGIGKTELAKKYAEEYRDFYHNIVLINAEKRETTLESFKVLAKRVGIKLNEKEDVKRERDLKDVTEEIYLYFNKSGKTLMVFDNVEEYCDVSKFLFNNVYECNNIYTLITSRCRDWNVGEKGDIELITLSGFTEVEAIDFLVKGLESENKHDLMTLMKVLQRFPLALKQAVGYIQQQVNSKRKRKSFTVEDYLSLYEKQKIKLLSERGKNVDDVYTQTVATTWRITIEKIEDLGECGKLAKSIFNIMAYLAPENVDIEKLFFKLEKDEDKLYDAAELLDKYCLINLDTGIANVHRLVQESTKIYLMETNEEEAVLRDSLKIMNTTDFEEHFVSVWEHSSKYPQLVKDFYSSSICGYYEETPIHLLASYHKNCVAISNILKHVDCINSKDKINDTPLHNASKNGNIDVVKFLIEKGANLNLKNHFMNLPIHFATINGHINVVKYLIDKDDTIASEKNYTNNTPVDLAVINGHINVVEILRPRNNESYLLFARFNNAVRKNDIGQCEEIIKSAEETNILQSLFLESNAFHVAASYCDDKMIKYLVNCGFDINLNNNNKDTPLIYAAKNKNIKEIKLLLELGADPTITNENGYNALYYLVNFDAVEEFELLLSKGADLNCQTLLHRAVEAGSIKILQLLIDKGVNINMTNKYGNTPLIRAAFSKKYQALKLLLEMGADPTISNEFDETALHYVAKSDAVEEFELLLSKGADLNAKDKNESSPLHWAAEDDSLKILQLLFDKGVNINMTNKYGNTPLIRAASLKKYLALKLLLELGANPTISNEYGFTALDYIVIFDAFEEFELLFSKGADLNHRNKDNSSLLHRAAEAGHLKMLQMLFDRGVDINMTNKDGHTPLIIAASFEKHQALKLLLELGADPTISNENGNTALHYVAHTDAVGEFELLLSNGADVNCRNKDDSSPLHWAAEDGSLKILQLLFNRGVDINMTNKYGNTPLINAASLEKYQTLKLLLELGADPTINNKNGETVLHYVAKFDAVDEFELLLSNGADLNCRNKDDSSPLHRAAESGSLKILQLLFDKGGDINMTNKYGNTPLCLAAMTGHLQTLKWLLENGSNPKIANKNKMTLLHFAAEACDVDGLKFVIQLGFDLAVVDKLGNSILHSAVHGKNKTAIKFFIEEGIDPNISDYSLLTPLHDICCVSGDIDTVKLLIKLGANPNSLDKFNRSPLHLASQKDNYDAATILIEEGAEINACDTHGESALLRASAKCHLRMIGMLLENGADVNVYDDKGRSPLHHLTRNGKLEGVKLLLKHGADPCKLDKAGHTLLHLAAVHFQYRDVNYFIQNVKNIDVNARDDDNKTPLHLAASCGRVDIVGLLIRRGAETNAKDKFDNTPLNCSIMYNRTKVIDLFNIYMNGKVINTLK